MVTVIAISGHRDGEDAAGVPDDLEDGAVGSGLGAVKVDEGYGRVVCVGVVVEDAKGGGQGASRWDGPSGVVGVEFGVVGRDSGDCD